MWVVQPGVLPGNSAPASRVVASLLMRSPACGSPVTPEPDNG
jgi:hypothetical protein